MIVYAKTCKMQKWQSKMLQNDGPINQTMRLINFFRNFTFDIFNNVGKDQFSKFFQIMHGRWTHQSQSQSLHCKCCTTI